MLKPLRVGDLFGASLEHLSIDPQFYLTVLDEVARPIPFQPESNQVHGVALHEKPGGHGVALSSLTPDGGDLKCAAVLQGSKTLLQGVRVHRTPYRMAVGCKEGR